jgi:EmrB/QacA subfamily drug resistance transporter
VLGPLLGGFFVDNLSWRWIFYVNIPIVVLALFMAARLLNPDSGRADAGRLDWRGFLLISPGLVGIVFGLSEIETQGGIGEPIAFGPIVAGIVLVLAFVRHSLHADRPLIDVGLFREACFSSAAATTFLLGAALFGAMLLIPLYYQVARETSPLGAGLLMAPQGLGAAAVMPVAGALTDRIGGGRVALAGVITMAVGTIPFVAVGATTPYVLLAVFLVVRGVGLGAAMMPAMAAAYATLRPADVPRATSALNAIQRVGGSIGTALLAVVLQHELATALPSAGGSGIGAVAGAPPAAAVAPLAGAFADTFWGALALCLLAIVPAAVLAWAQRRAAVGEAATAVSAPGAA